MNVRTGCGMLGFSILALLAASPDSAQGQKVGHPANSYTVTVHAEQIDASHWEAVVYLENAGPIAAMTLPFRWGQGRESFRIDSADYSGMRTEYFALKTFRVDTTQQSVLIGLISDLGSNLPPLEPGEGPIARLHFTAVGKRSTSPLTLDTTFVRPHNTLQLVTPDVRAITPEFHSPGTAQSMRPQ